MKIRSKISLYLGPFVLVIVTAIFILNYFVVRRELSANAHIELAKIEKNMHRAAQSLLNSAIANYLRGITEKNIDFIDEQYAAYKTGRITEAEAKARIQIHFDLQSVGESGYLVAVRESAEHLYLDLHPYLPRQDCTEIDACKAWVHIRNGYMEYNWKNPADNTFRKKAAYLQEFPQWNWIVGASSYHDEFINLIQVEDLQNLLSPIKINRSGYFFVFDKNHTLLIHPESQNLDGSSIVNRRGESILQLLQESKSGYLTYLWKNPSEQKEHMKYAFVEKLEIFDWYLVATGYLDEVYEPIQYLKNLTIFLVLLTAAALFLIIFRLSKHITSPLLLLEEGVNNFYEKQLHFKWRRHNIVEIDILGDAFSRMTEELTRSMVELQSKNNELALSEREKERSSNLLDGIINSMPSIIIGVDPQLHVSQWNSRAEKMTLFCHDEIRGKSLFEVFPELLVHKETLFESLTSNEVCAMSHTTTDQDGKTHFSEITIYPLLLSDNEGAVIRIDEVTERVEMEQRLRQSQKMDAIGQLTGGIAHDFNNMLSGIIGAAELLRIKVSPENQKLVKIIAEASGRAAELIQKLLAFSRKEPVSFKTLNMHIIIHDTIEILQRSLDKRISVVAQLQAESSQVLGDWSLLQNSLLNIGINAGHAMPDGGTLSFSTKIITLDDIYCDASPFNLQPGQFIHIAIRDSGCGIAKENIKRIFEPFFTTRQQNKGTGLGLAAVYGTVQRHGGAISVYSEPGTGTEFCIVLPLSKEIEAIATQQHDLIPGEGNILVIDDEMIIRTTARLMLEKLGYNVLEANNGKEGLDVYKQATAKIDLVLLDMLMPVMDGAECFHKLISLDPNVRVIISSGFTRDADLTPLKEAGLCNFVRKPYNMTELSEVISQALSEWTSR
jgi:PAS domain S-box-containing protein